MDPFVLSFFEESSSSSSSDSDLKTDSEDEFHFLETNDAKNSGFMAIVERYSEEEFMYHFRVGRTVASFLTERFQSSKYYNPQSGYYGKLDPFKQVLIMLWFSGHQFAPFRDMAKRFNITLSSLYRVIRRMIYFISNLSDEVIKWPSEEEKIESAAFFGKKGIPHIIGAIRGTHIRINKPATDSVSYHNSMKYFSIQMQVVCDHTYAIRNLFVGFPGSVPVARVFLESPLNQNLADKCGNYIILGDSAYPCSRHLITPFKIDRVFSKQESLFNQKHSSCRSVVDQCIGLLRQKFQQLYHCKLRDIKDVVHFVRACCVLHNLSLKENVSPEQETVESDPESSESMEPDFLEGLEFRNHLLTTIVQ